MPRLGHDVAPSQRAQFFSAEVAASGFSPVVGFSTVLGATPLVPLPTASDTFAKTIGGSLAALSSLTATTLYSGAGIPSYESGALSAAIELRDNVGALVANVKTAIKGVSGALTEKVKAVVSEIAQAVQSKIAPILGRMIEATPVVRQIAGVLSAVVDAVKKVISWLDSRGQSTAGVTPADLAPYSAGGDPWAELEETSTPGAIPAAAEVSGMLQRLEVSGGRALWTLGGPQRTPADMCPGRAWAPETGASTTTKSSRARAGWSSIPVKIIRRRSRPARFSLAKLLGFPPVFSMWTRSMHCAYGSGTYTRGTWDSCRSRKTATRARQGAAISS